MAAITVSDLQTSLAYRLGENSAPNVTAESDRRLSFINEAYRSVMMRQYWWFAESTATFNSVADQTSYGTADGVPTDLRAILELRYNGVVQTPITQIQAMSSYSTPYNKGSQSYFLFQGKIYPVPPYSSSITDGIAMKYYRGFTKLTSSSDTILIPETYSDVIVAYAYARFSILDSERGSAADGFDEFNEILQAMTIEQNRYNFMLKDHYADTEFVNFFS